MSDTQTTVPFTDGAGNPQNQLSMQNSGDTAVAPQSYLRTRSNAVTDGNGLPVVPGGNGIVLNDASSAGVGGGAWTTIVAQNTSRIMLYIQNRSASNIDVWFGTAAPNSTTYPPGTSPPGAVLLTAQSDNHDTLSSEDFGGYTPCDGIFMRSTDPNASDLVVTVKWA